MKFVLRMAALLALGIALPCLSDSPFFSLTTTRSFGSNELPEVQLAGVGVGAVQIRVYRIEDAAAFYGGLENAHNFGSFNPQRGHKLTWLETVHDWKRGLRREIRSSLRGQFTESPSAHLFGKSEAVARTEKPVSKETYFAQAPVLNQQQLVLSFIQPVASGDRWSSSPVPIRVKDKGVYLVEAVHQNLRAYTILNVTDLVMINKTGKTQVLSYLADRMTGEPVAGAEIMQVGKSSNRAKQETEADGTSTFALPAGNVESLRFLAVRGKDVAFNEVNAYYAGRESWSGYIYTDRPVYRPGDTIHFRGILRKQAVVGYQTPAGESVNVQITDPEGKTIFQKPLTTNSNGVIHAELATEKTSALGNFYIQVQAGENIMSGNFEVQEYKKPEYEVHVLPESGRVLEGETVKATIDSKYYFGEPVAGAKVSYSIHRSRNWFPFWSEPGEDVDDGEGQADEGGESADETNQGEGVLDADGKLVISVPTTVSDEHEDFRYRIEAGVTDKAGREISGTGWVIATYGEFNVFARPESYVVTPGADARIRVSTRDYDNKPVSAAVHIQVATWDWRERKTAGAVVEADVTTGEDGTATATVKTPDAGGEIRVLATARSGARVVQQASYIWAPANGFNWDFSNERNLKIVADKASYKAGDKAKLLVVTGKPGVTVLVTVEGRDLRSHQILKAQGSTVEVEYPVAVDDEPGFFVSAQFISDGTMYSGQKRVLVPPEQHKLSVTVTSDKATYLPGQTGNFEIHATTWDGKPAANADLSMGVVDEAVYGVRRDETPDILNFFFGREYDSVITQTSLEFYFSGEAGVRRMRLAELRGSSKLAQLKPEQLVKPKVRKYFPDTAFWQADLTTDEQGRVRAQIPFPDSITTWRATVRGVGQGDEFGSYVSKVIVRKNLILRLAAPRFFVQSDEVVLSAIVHNYLQTAKKAKVSLAVEGLQLMNGNATQEVEIASRAEAKVDWRVKAQQATQAKLTGEALTDEESDALEVTLPIHAPGIALQEARSGSIADSGAQTVAMTFPGSAVNGSRTLSIRLSSSVAGSIFSALDYLTSFPYGCVEQTMSSFLPDIMVQKSVRELGLKQQVDQQALDEKIKAGLERLYSFQHPDGGWGWWETDESHPFMTAYVVAGLAEARADGVSVDGQAVNRGVAWVRKALNGGEDLEPDLRAYMLYALTGAGAADSAGNNKLFGERTTLSPYGTALLGLALEGAKDARASQLADVLQSKVQDTGAEASWPATRDAMLDFEADVTPESTAFAMKFLSHESPKSPLLAKAALWLVNHRNEGYWWSSTKQTAMVIYGLIDYLKTTNELHPDLTGVVMLNGKKIGEQKFSSDGDLSAHDITLEEAQLNAASNQVEVESQGKGRLYYAVTAGYHSNDARLEKNGAVSLNLLRDYYRLVPAKTGDRIVYDLKPFEGAASPGEIIAVRLTVTGSDWRYLLLEDPIPAGTEFIEKDNLYEIANKPPWWRYWFSRRELHDNRMAIFDTFFYEQQKQYFYLLKVVNPGTFQVSPARVEPMYQPGHLATTESRTLEVTAQ